MQRRPDTGSSKGSTASGSYDDNIDLFQTSSNCYPLTLNGLTSTKSQLMQQQQQQQQQHLRGVDGKAMVETSAQSKHRRVHSCLAQLESLNLERPPEVESVGEGTSRMAPWVASQATHPGHCHDARDPHAQLLAARAQTEIQDLLNQRQAFARDAV